MYSFLKNAKGIALIEYQYVGIIAIITILSTSYVAPFFIDRTNQNTIALENNGLGVNTGTDNLLSTSVASTLNTPIASENVTNPPEETPLEDTIPEMRYACFNEGIVASGQTRIRSVNSFSEGFCLHGNEGVWLRNNNVFAFGSIISAPSQNLINIPGNSNNNPGLNEAFQIAKLDIDVPLALSESYNYLVDASLNGRPSYLHQTADVITLQAGSRLDPKDLQKGRVYNISCGGSGKLEFRGSLLLSEIGIVTNCEIKFPSNFKMENAVIATTNTSSRSFNSPSGLQIGRDDNCTPGGGAQLLTMGGTNIASNLKLYGGHLVAAGNIDISAWIDGEGALILSGNNIDGRTNITMISCDGIGMEDNIIVSWWDLIISFFF